MTIELKNKDFCIEVLPDITTEVKDVFVSFNEACKKDTKSAERFLDAWLAMQKENGIVSFYRELQEKTRVSV
jgi:hypothetical protein